jgi:hypothetical protein
MCCACTPKRNGSYRVKDCIRKIKIHQGTSGYPWAREVLEESSSMISDTEESSSLVSESEE